jgi:hypothetical protein
METGTRIPIVLYNFLNLILPSWNKNERKILFKSPATGVVTYQVFLYKYSKQGCGSALI